LGKLILGSGFLGRLETFWASWEAEETDQYKSGAVRFVRRAAVAIQL
jgi:hypothetical protein